LEEGEVVSRGLFEAGGEGSKTLQIVEEDLNAVTLSVPASVDARFSFSGWIWADDGFDMVLLTRRELDVDRASFGVDERVDLGGETTSRTTQRIADDPPFPPAASW
jgi:hypothetical protein